MKNIKKSILFLYCFLMISTIFLHNVKLLDILTIPEGFYSNYSEIYEANNNKYFGDFVNMNIETNKVATDDKEPSEGYVIFKLFGFIPIRKVKVKILPSQEVYVGGNPIGMKVKSKGVVIVSDSIIDLESSTIEKNKILKNGDIILRINGQDINSMEDIDKVLDYAENGRVVVDFKRDNKEQTKEITLLKNDENKYKLGVWVRDDFSGVGTLTFVRKDNFEFAALGHPVTNDKSENIIDISDGQLYNCSLVGINKGYKNDPGELKCVFVQKNQEGNIIKNTKFGIYGYLNNTKNLIDTNLTANLGGRLSVKPGKAKLISSVSGIREEYDIEIIKANYQSKSNDKSIIFRVKDKRLLELTGGIVQGMSGSPIMQNGKLIGAVTHVFLSDPTKGYAVYSDWMLEQMS